MKTLIPIISLLLFACGNSKEATKQESDKEKYDEDVVYIYEPYRVDSIAEIEALPADYNVYITLFNYHPYCGGMAPTQEMLDNQTSPYSNTTFIFIDHQSGEEERMNTDENGMFKFQLPPGEYSIRETFKDTTFDAFYAQNVAPNSEYYSSGDVECYEHWWASNLVDFTITKEDSVYEYSATRYARCFTGNNPCSTYNGPYPP